MKKLLPLFVILSMYGQDYIETFNKGLKNYQNGDFDTALTLFNQTIEQNPACPQAYFNAGVIYYYQNNNKKAEQMFTNAIQYKPEYAKAHYYLGLVYQRQNKFQDALEAFGSTLTIDPLFDDAYLHMARIARDKGDSARAQKLYRHFLNKQPTNMSINLEYGNVLVKNNEFEKAVTIYEHIIAQDPNNNSVRLNLGHTLRYLGKFQEAIPVYQEVIKHIPQSAPAHYGLAESLLATGNFKDGWHHWEWRWKRGHEDQRNFTKKLWNSEPLDGKTILLRAEYGQGDTIQFIRYAQSLKKQGAHVIAEVQHSLVPLLSACPYLDLVFGVNQQFVEQLSFDYQIPLMSLAGMVDTKETAHPYVFPSPQLIDHWQKKIAQDNKFKIGVCWATSPYFAAMRSPLSQKNVPLNDFIPLLKNKDYSFYSLQQIDGLEQLKTLPDTIEIKTFENFDITHGRFMDTAALMVHLDLVITVDTSVAHLAGALGKEVWVLLPFVADWRWQTNETKSRWYETMKLFRQTKPGNWDEVLQKVEQELAKKLNPPIKNGTISTEIAIGELFDKITILQIKNEKISDPKKLKNIRIELATLVATAKKYIPESKELNTYIDALRKANKILWDIEDNIRAKEFNQEFDEEFIHLARGVYINNDHRCAIKRKINELCGSRIVEEKSYQEYKK